MMHVFTTKFYKLLLISTCTALQGVRMHQLIIVVYRYLPVYAKSGIALLPCIYEWTVLLIKMDNTIARL